jgi:hypothetical protein
MRTDKAGNTLWRTVSVKVIFPDGIFPDRKYRQNAGPKQGFGPDGIDQMLNQIADELDSLYPWWQFRAVELSPIGSTVRFAFIFAGNNTNYVAPAPTIHPTADSTTPGPETAEDTTLAAIIEAVGTTLQDLSSQEPASSYYQEVKKSIQEENQK